MITQELRRRTSARGGDSVDWESIARGMIDGVTEFSIPASIELANLDSLFYQRRGLKSVVIPSNITSLPNSLFRYCYGLNSVMLHNAITKIGQRVFEYCTSLSSIELPSSLTTIDMYAFMYSGLVSITIPSSVTSLGAQSFRFCRQLQTVVMQSSTPPTLGANTVFSNGHSGLTIYVPDGSVEAYKTATNWSAFADKIKPLSELGGGI